MDSKLVVRTTIKCNIGIVKGSRWPGTHLCPADRADRVLVLGVLTPVAFLPASLPTLLLAVLLHRRLLQVNDDVLICAVRADVAGNGKGKTDLLELLASRHLRQQAVHQIQAVPAHRDRV